MRKKDVRTKLKVKKFILLAIGLGGLFMAGSVWAHQPRLVGEEEVVNVSNPEVSQAFYAELSGQPVTYVIEEEESFYLYVGLLVPDIEGVEVDKDYLARVDRELDDGSIEEVLLLDGPASEWPAYYEQFAGDDYFYGPEGEKEVEAGRYKVEVSSPDNQGKYVLVIGKKEEFPAEEIVATAEALPELKTDYFEKSFWSVFSGVIGIAVLVIIGCITLTVALVIWISRRKKKEQRR